MAYIASGLGAAVEGFYQGSKDEETRQRRTADLAYQDEQRAFGKRKQEADLAAVEADRKYVQGQRTRTQDAQGREDQLRTDLAGVSATRKVTVPGQVALDDDGNTMPTAQKSMANPAWAQLRQAADAYRKAGKFTEYLEATGKADQLQLTDATSRLNQLESAAAGKTTAQIAKEAQQIFDTDPFPQRVVSVQEQPDGSVVAELENTDSGQRVSQTYKSPADIINGMRAIYNEKGYAMLQTERQKAAAKVAAEAADPSKRYIRVGNAIYDTQTKGFTQAPVPPGHEYIGTNERGDAEFRRIGGTTGGGRSGSGSGKGKGNGDGSVVSEAREILASAAEKSEDKLTGNQRVAAEDFVGRISTQNPNMPAAMVARVSMDLAKDPNKALPAIDPETGNVDLVYDDGINGKVKVHIGVGDALNLNSVSSVIAQRMAAANGGKPPSPEDVKSETLRAMTTMTKTMVEGFDPKRRLAYEQAARDPLARRKLEDQLRQTADQAFSKVSSTATPEQQDRLKAAKEQAIGQRMQAMGNVLNLIHSYGDKPAPANAPAKVGGLGLIMNAARRGLSGAADFTPDPASPAGKAAAVRAQATAGAQQKEQAQQASQAQLSEQFQRDAKTMKPLELVRKYDSMRRQLPAADAQALKQFEQQL